MSHELEVHNGKASFVSARLDAWHRLGTVLEDTFDAQTAMEKAYLAGWNVRKQPMYTYVSDSLTGDQHLEQVPDQFANVRTNPHTGGIDQLGVSGNFWTPIQNEENADLLNEVVEQSGAHFQTAGSLRGGRETFLTMELPDTMTVGGIDPVRVNIAALNSHDGRSAFKLIVTPTRIVCANTQAAALRDAVSKFSIRHTVNYKDAAAEARAALGLTWKYIAAFEEEAERMIQQTTTDAQFAEIVAGLLGEAPEPDAKGAVAERARRQREDLMGLFTESPTNTEIRGTRWAAYQAFTEYADFFSPVRAKAGKDEVRALKVVSGKADEFKSRAFDLCRVGA